MITSVITHYRDTNYLEESLESLLNQTLLPTEIIIVDDFSNDGSIEKINKIVKSRQKVPIQIIERTTNGGLPAARNSAIKVCKTPYISFLDCDDIYYSKKLEKSVAALDKYKEIGIVYSDFDILDETSKTVRREYKFTYDIRLFVQTCIISTNSVFRMKVFQDCGLYDESWRTTEDYELYFRVMPYFMAYHIPESLFAYRQHAKQLTQVYQQKIIAETQQLIKRGLVYREST